MKKHALVVLGLIAASTFLAVLPSGCGRSSAQSATSHELLNVSYDPTRELWKQINARFIPLYERQAGIKVSINQSHGGSSSQARQIIDGLAADVATLALWSDTDAIRKAGLIKEGWQDRLPNGSLPYSSTITFVVRKGNPKQIKDWPDLLREGVEVVTPSPKTSGNGKLSFLSAWGAIVLRGGSEQDATDFVTKLYKDHVKSLEAGARAATTTFAQKGLGDVHLTWENEAHLEIREAGDQLEMVYPPISIRAEPRVAVVDANVDRKGTRASAEAYLKFLYTDEAQQILAENFYRPYKPEILHQHSKSFPEIQLFSIKEIASGWDEAEKRFFATDGVFDAIYLPPAK